MHSYHRFDISRKGGRGHTIITNYAHEPWNKTIWNSIKIDNGSETQDKDHET